MLMSWGVGRHTVNKYRRQAPLVADSWGLDYCHGRRNIFEGSLIVAFVIVKTYLHALLLKLYHSESRIRLLNHLSRITRLSCEGLMFT